MELSFRRVLKNDENMINEIYKIITLSGQDMFEKQGLVHWKTPYPIESIKADCENREVFLIKDLQSDLYVHTFQLEFEPKTMNNKIKGYVSFASINKFATLPVVSGKGIGKKSMDFIEDYCREKEVSKITLDVYDKSEKAIKFYKNRGFSITSSKPTKHFSIYIMEKIL
ncbi:GNAT family N-acetyltransferase [Oceanobacillus alkalisoli]|uniref:GNAT family N-acetyltransferase n=1 Tax=Oceanobacillus alkalisoli TaxID=2925113 RepID=UPI001F121142|nr:GNAT family N-acetyltransferase [Oceanobacillus alkalisoli]MCF3942628.1 GNAT family N-acetyltransferase [Oceanobacillus alkalisoli]